MRSLILIISTLFYLSCGNIEQQEFKAYENKYKFANKLFTIAPDVNKETCQTVAECDCCTSDLLFLDESSFLIINYCMGDQSVVKGTYHINDGELILNQGLICVKRDYNWTHDLDSTAVPFLIKKEELSPTTLKFKMLQCDNRLLLQLLGNTTEFGMQNSTKNGNTIIQGLKNSGVWDSL